MFVVMIVRQFAIEAHPIFGETKLDSGKMCGYLPCYEKRDDAEAEHPGATIFEAVSVADQVGKKG